MELETWTSDARAASFCHPCCCDRIKEKQFWAFSKTIRLKKYGRKRLVIVHEQEDLSNEPRFLLADALHEERGCYPNASPNLNDKCFLRA